MVIRDIIKLDNLILRQNPNLRAILFTSSITIFKLIHLGLHPNL